MDADYSIDVIDDRILITTDKDAPNYRVMSTSVETPGQEHWTELIPESKDKLSYISAVAGHLYAVYEHNASSRIAVYTLDGTHLHDVELPTVGSAGVSGYWTKPDAHISFSSFAHPSTTYD